MVSNFDAKSADNFSLSCLFSSSFLAYWNQFLPHVIVHCAYHRLLECRLNLRQEALVLSLLICPGLSLLLQEIVDLTVLPVELGFQLRILNLQGAKFLFLPFDIFVCLLLQAPKFLYIE